MDSFSIFLSHKSHDELLAKKLNEILCRYCSALLQVYRMEEISTGTQWMTWIRTKLAKSNMLMLLFTDPTADWDWCLYEAGLFTGMHEDAVLKGCDEEICQRVVCVHNQADEKTLPPQLHALQKLDAGKFDKVMQFLKELYVDKKLAPNVQAENNRRLLELTQEFVNAWSENKVIRTESYGKQVQIEIPNASLMLDDGSKIPLQANVTGDGLELFGLRGRHPWRDLEEKAVASDDQKWISELAESMSKVCRNNLPSPIQGIYSMPGDKTDRGYRPCLYRADWTKDSIKFFVLFSEEPSLREDNDVVKPILEFSELMNQLIKLFDSSEGLVKMLAFTPALGFLARTKEEWASLEDKIRSNARRIAITCLCQPDLEDWHSRFINRHTERGRVTPDLTEAASEWSENLLRDIPIKTRLRWSQLPDYYAFKTDKRAILVTPFHLPRRDEPVQPGGEAGANLPNVQMYGSVTNHPQIVTKIESLQDYYARRPQAGGHGA